MLPVSVMHNLIPEVFEDKSIVRWYKRSLRNVHLPHRETKSKELFSSLGSPSLEFDPILSLFSVVRETLFANIGSGSELWIIEVLL